MDKNPIACVALHVYPEESKGELACLYVRPSHENQGIGRTMVQFVESKARELGLGHLLALSTQAFNYFQVEGRLRRGHARRPASRPPREVRRERPPVEGAGEEAVAGQGLATAAAAAGGAGNRASNTRSVRLRQPAHPAPSGTSPPAGR